MIIEALDLKEAYMPTKVKSATKLQPLGDRIVVRPIKREEVTKGGIVLPDTAKEKPQEGEVIAVGMGDVDSKGNKIPLSVKVGDKIIFSSYAGVEFNPDEENEYLILSEDEVLVVLN